MPPEIGRAPSSRRQVVRLDRVALNVGDLSLATRFYCDALGFTQARPSAGEPALARLLGVGGIQTTRLRRGRQMLELSLCDPPGAPMPQDGRSNDAWFQHCALVTGDMEGAYDRLRRFDFTPISRDGPQHLPGGIVAFKFRDPDGHPLELIAFATPDLATVEGIDHSAICVADQARSIAFYEAKLGLAVHAQQVNQGPAQDALDDLDDVVVDVVALMPTNPAPHLELLGYRRPGGREALASHPSDVAASRLVCVYQRPSSDILPVKQPDEPTLELLRDPDGHLIVLTQQS